MDVLGGGLALRGVEVYKFPLRVAGAGPLRQPRSSCDVASGCGGLYDDDGPGSAEDEYKS